MLLFTTSDCFHKYKLKLSSKKDPEAQDYFASAYFLIPVSPVFGISAANPERKARTISLLN